MWLKLWWSSLYSKLMEEAAVNIAVADTYFYPVKNKADFGKTKFVVLL